MVARKARLFVLFLVISMLILVLAGWAGLFAALAFVFVIVKDDR